MPKNMRIKVIAASSGVILFGGLPAVAQLNSGELGAVWESFKEYADDFRNYADQKYDEFFAPDVAETIRINRTLRSQEEPRLPNTVSDADALRFEIINKNYQPDQFENNKVARSSAVANDLSRFDTQAGVNFYFGNEQFRIKSKLQQAENIVERTVESRKNVAKAELEVSNYTCRNEFQSPNSGPFVDEACRVGKQISRWA